MIASIFLNREIHVTRNIRGLMLSSKCDKIFIKTLNPQNDYCIIGIEEMYSNKYTDHFHGKKYGIHRLGKLSVNFRKRSILLKFSRVFRS